MASPCAQRCINGVLVIARRRNNLAPINRAETPRVNSQLSSRSATQIARRESDIITDIRNDIIQVAGFQMAPI